MTLSKAWASLAVPDQMLMHRVNRWMAPKWVRWWIIAATRVGDGWLWAAYGFMLLF